MELGPVMESGLDSTGTAGSVSDDRIFFANDLIKTGISIGRPLAVACPRNMRMKF